MRIAYTYHAHRKIKEEKYVRQLKITKKIIREVVEKPDFEDKTRGEKITAVGKLGSRHSLKVVYKKERGIIKIITFFPARKGRYESKILQKR